MNKPHKKKEIRSHENMVVDENENEDSDGDLTDENPAIEILSETLLSLNI
jgi:hypothetical protein